MTGNASVAAHSELITNHYLMHFPAHEPRAGDPHYVDFETFHRLYRPNARCYVGERIGFDECKDEHGQLAPAPENGEQPGLELHHAHIEFALQNAIDLAALEKDYPGISDPDTLGKWVESGANFRWLCSYHHRGASGAHKASHSDWEASQYIRGLIS